VVAVRHHLTLRFGMELCLLDCSQHPCRQLFLARSCSPDSTFYLVDFNGFWHALS